jgi:hypothetical protein
MDGDLARPLFGKSGRPRRRDTPALNSAVSDAIREETALALSRVIDEIDRVDSELRQFSQRGDPDLDVGDTVAEADDAARALHRCRAKLSVLAWNAKARASA